MNPDASPSRPREMPHSRLPFSVLVGDDVLIAGGFNAGEVSLGRFTSEGRHYDIFVGQPDGYDDEQTNVIIGAETIVKGAVWYNRWHAGTILGLPRGRRDEEGASDFDSQVDEIISREEIPYTDLRGKVISLIPEEKLRQVGVIE